MLIAMKARPATTPSDAAKRRAARKIGRCRARGGCNSSTTPAPMTISAAMKRKQAAFGPGRADKAERPGIGRRGRAEQDPEQR